LLPQYENLVQNAIEYAAAQSGSFEEKLAIAMDKLAVNFGAEITKIVPGYVSTEVDARLSFDTNATVDRARRIIRLYEEMGIDKSRIWIKVFFFSLFCSFYSNRLPQPMREFVPEKFLRERELLAISLFCFLSSKPLHVLKLILP
jgi:hypothetical protein